MCEKPIICLLLILHVLGPLKTLISEFMRARLCVCQNKGECMRERERERERERGGGERAIHVLLIHSIFLLLLFFSFFLYSTYSIRILHSLQD